MWMLIPEPDSGQIVKTIKRDHGQVIFSGIEHSAPRAALGSLEVITELV
jgi:hypothetical protein